jgi:SAM-dependent methyltransferase
VSTQTLPPGAAASSDALARTAKWLVGDRLSCVLHLGDSALAYRLNEQGHEVLVAGDDILTIRDPQIQYVRARPQRLPFVSSSFDAILTPHLDVSATTLAEWARVLRAEGLLSTLSGTHDDSIPWVRKLREIVGSHPPASSVANAMVASGLFDEPETEVFAVWEELNLDGVLRFAHDTGAVEIDAVVERQVRELFASYSSHAGFIRLRHETRCLRARVRKDALPSDPEPQAATLLDLA